MKPQPPSTTPPGAAPSRASGTEAEAARPPLVRSEQLLQGHRAIEISHNGVLYRLQATRFGKLILTK